MLLFLIKFIESRNMYLFQTLHMPIQRVLPPWLKTVSGSCSVLPYYPLSLVHKETMNAAVRQTIRQRLGEWHSMYWETCLNLNKNDKNSFLFWLTFDNILLILRYMWERERYVHEFKRVNEPMQQFPYRPHGPQGSWLRRFMTVEDFPLWSSMGNRFGRVDPMTYCLQFIEGKIAMLLSPFETSVWQYQKMQRQKKRNNRIEIYECCNGDKEFYTDQLSKIFGQRNFDRFVIVQKFKPIDCITLAPVSILRIMFIGAEVPREVVEESLVLKSLRCHELNKLPLVAL